MKKRWIAIQLISITALVIFCFGFAGQRHAKRDFSGVEVYFKQGENRFLTMGDVKASLKNPESDSVRNLSHYRANLRQLETGLKENQLIDEAEVYLDIKGKLKTEIKQKKPIARIVGKNSFYLDTNGQKMPLSPHFSAHVPLVENKSKVKVDKIFPILIKIHADKFLSSLITGLNFKDKGNIELFLRDLPLNVQFGKIESIDRKFNNLKAFYKKMQKSKSFKKYKSINLTFENQVVATKK